MKSENPDVQHFLSIPWCAAHLTSSTIRETPSSRYSKPSGEDNFFSKTLNTPGTITAFLSFYNAPPPGGPPLVREVDFLVTLGPDVAGYPSISHGGLVAALLDEVLGTIFPVNKARGAIPEQAYMTGYLNTSYLKPVKVPGTYLCRAKVVRVEGRKCFMLGTIEDESGTVLAKADTLYLAVREKL